MKSTRIIKIILALSQTFLSSIALAEANPCTTVKIESQQAINLGQSYRLDTGQQGKQLEVNVYLPDSYYQQTSAVNDSASNTEIDKTKHYPVLYVIDGGQQQDFKQIAGLGALASINPYIFEELIVVGIATQNRLYELTSMNVDKRYNRAQGELGGADQFRSKIRHIVQPFINQNYRASSRKIVVGESLAGLFISETLIKTPDLFTDYIAISPSLWYDDRQLTKQAAEFLSKHNNKARSLYLTMANEGGTMQKGLDELLNAIQKSGLENLKTQYIDRRDNQHHWTIYHEAVLDALRWMLAVPGPDYASDEDPWYLIEGANPPDWND
ncbi:MAG: putative alpha/beta superfamily hydrolase [Arenicella sp.]|jgi:predicted alpha/beta superfamily hydrolase